MSLRGERRKARDTESAAASPLSRSRTGLLGPGRLRKATACFLPSPMSLAGARDGALELGLRHLRAALDLQPLRLAVELLLRLLACAAGSARAARRLRGGSTRRALRRPRGSARALWRSPIALGGPALL